MSMAWRRGLLSISLRIQLGALLFLASAVPGGLLMARPVDYQPWILVDTGASEIRVMRGKETLEVIPNISVGRGGVGYKSREGDDVTPTGAFRIAWINRSSPFYRFFGFDYPTRSYAERARMRHFLNEEEYRQIVEAHDQGEIPPQTTPLGGRVGIHGIGAADARIHSRFNWTAGCVALTDRQIDRLSRWAHVGTLVVVTR